MYAIAGKEGIMTQAANWIIEQIDAMAYRLLDFAGTGWLSPDDVHDEGWYLWRLSDEYEPDDWTLIAVVLAEVVERGIFKMLDPIEGEYGTPEFIDQVALYGQFAGPILGR